MIKKRWNAITSSRKSIKNCKRFILTYVYSIKSSPFYKLYLFHMQISSSMRISQLHLHRIARTDYDPFYWTVVLKESGDKTEI